jgi:hypothetical protein
MKYNIRAKKEIERVFKKAKKDKKCGICLRDIFFYKDFNMIAEVRGGFQKDDGGKREKKTIVAYLICKECNNAIRDVIEKRIEKHP